jgi:hypothetical protein
MILIGCGQIDRAWAAAQEFGCSDSCRLLLARSRAKDHPADAIAIFAVQVEDAIARKGTSGYSMAADLIVTMKDLHQWAGKDFDAYLDGGPAHGPWVRVRRAPASKVRAVPRRSCHCASGSSPVSGANN